MPALLICTILLVVMLTAAMMRALGRAAASALVVGSLGFLAVRLRRRVARLRSVRKPLRGRPAVDPPPIDPRESILADDEAYYRQHAPLVEAYKDRTGQWYGRTIPTHPTS
jgi:hypothetical protein